LKQHAAGMGTFAIADTVTLHLITKERYKIQYTLFAELIFETTSIYNKRINQRRRSILINRSAMDAAVPDPALLAMNKLNKGSKCRACLSVDRKTVQLNAEVPNLQKTRTYAQSLKQCTNLDLRVISPGGYLWPMQICVRCCRALEVAMHFVEMALESNLKLQAEAKSVKLPSPTGELKRKASNETIPWNQFSQEFEQFVEGYEGPIEENVLYMRGTKVPRLDVDASSSSETAPKEDEGRPN